MLQADKNQEMLEGLVTLGAPPEDNDGYTVTDKCPNSPQIYAEVVKIFNFLPPFRGANHSQQVHTYTVINHWSASRTPTIRGQACHPARPEKSTHGGLIHVSNTR